MALHPQAVEFLALIEEAGFPPMEELTPVEARAQARLSIELIGPGAEVAAVEDFTIPTSSGEIAARSYTPADPLGNVLWLHGGGWVICDLDTHDAMCRMLANSSGCRVIAVDYRLAPEHPFPAPIEDCWDALQWVAERYADMPLILGGDSAGGDLAAVCAMRARDRRGPALALQVLVYPVTDHDLTTPSYVEHGSGPETFLTKNEMAWFWHHYVSDPQARANPEASPLRAADFSMLPSAIVITAGYDPLRDEGIAFAERLRDAGGEVAHQHYDDMIHGFFSFVNVLDRGDEAVQQVGGEIRAVLAASSAAA
jgi:acetyl esterase